MPANSSNIFPTIIDTIEAFGCQFGLNETDSLTGIFKVKRKFNGNGIAKVHAFFEFKDELFSGLGSNDTKIKYKDRVANSIFGDAENPRTVESGKKKYDYYNNGNKIVELSIKPRFITEVENSKTIKGYFRVSLDGNFIAMSTGHNDQFQDNKILIADFEIPFLIGC